MAVNNNNQKNNIEAKNEVNPKKVKQPASKRQVTFDMRTTLKNIDNKVSSIDVKAEYLIKKVPVSVISLHPNNKFSMTGIDSLAKSISEVGMQHNIVLRPFSDPENPEISYQLISGHRRLLATKQNGTNEIMAKIVDLDDIETEKMLLILNLENRDLNNMERSDAVRRLVELVEIQKKAGVSFEGKRTREVVAEMLSNEEKSVSPAQVGQLNRLQDLVEEFKVMVAAGEISREAGYQYAQMPEEAQRMIIQAFHTGKDLTAKDAKKLKDSLAIDFEKQIEIMQETIQQRDTEALELRSIVRKKEEEVQKIQAEAAEAKSILSIAQENLRMAQENAQENIARLKNEIEEKVMLEQTEQAKAEIEKLNRNLEKAAKKNDVAIAGAKENYEILKKKNDDLEKALQKKMEIMETDDKNIKVQIKAQQLAVDLIQLSDNSVKITADTDAVLNKLEEVIRKLVGVKLDPPQ